MNKRVEKKQKFMSDATFGELKESLTEALQHSRGERSDLRTATLPAPPPPLTKEQIVELRHKLKCSQSVFAHVLNVKVKTLQAWEQGLRVPSDAALRLLDIARRHPRILLESN